MMPVQTRRDGDNVLVDSVDLKRSARNVLRLIGEPGWTPPKDVNQAMDLLARAFGYPNLHAALNSIIALPPAPAAAPKSAEAPSAEAGAIATLLKDFTPKMPEQVRAMSSKSLLDLMGLPSTSLSQEQKTWAFDELERHLDVGPSRTVIGLVGDASSARASWLDWARTLPGFGMDHVSGEAADQAAGLDRMLSRDERVVLVDGFCSQGSTLDERVAGMAVQSHLKSDTRLIMMAARAEDVVRNFRLPRVDNRLIPIKVRIIDFNRGSSYEIEMATGTVAETFSQMPPAGVSSGFRTAEQNEAISETSPRRRPRQ